MYCPFSEQHISDHPGTEEKELVQVDPESFEIQTKPPGFLSQATIVEPLFAESIPTHARDAEFICVVQVQGEASGVVVVVVVGVVAVVVVVVPVPVVVVVVPVPVVVVVVVGVVEEVVVVVTGGVVLLEQTRTGLLASPKIEPMSLSNVPEISVPINCPLA